MNQLRTVYTLPKFVHLEAEKGRSTHTQTKAHPIISFRFEILELLWKKNHEMSNDHPEEKLKSNTTNYK